MAYNEDKPAAVDIIRTSAADIRDNFADLKTAFDVNHVSLTGTAANEGKHNFIQFPEGQVPPVSDSQSGIAVAQGTTSAVSELQFSQLRRNGQETLRVPVSESSLASSGYSMTNGGIMIQWGFFDVAAGTTSRTTAFNPTFLNMYNIQVFVSSTTAATDPNTIAYVSQLSPLQFISRFWRRDSFNSPGAAQNVRVRFIAIGQR